MKKVLFKGVYLSLAILMVSIVLSACGKGNGTSVTPPKESSSPAATGTGTNPPLQPMDLSIVSCCISGTEIGMWVAYDNNLFQQYGINPKWNVLAPPTGVQAILSKDVQIGTAPGSAISAFANGSTDLVFVAGNDDKPVYRIMTKNISKPEDLKGKKLAVSGKYAPPAVAAMNYLEKQFQLKADVDYKVVPFQNIGDIVPALSQGVVDAGVLSTPLHLKAEKLGAKVLVDLSKSFDEANAYIITSRNFAQQNPEAVMRFLKAYASGIAMAKKNPEIAVASILKHQTGITQEEAKITYDDYINLLDVNMNPDALLPYQVYTDNAKAANVKAADMLDYSFLQKLDQSGFLKENGFKLKLPGNK